MVKIFNDLLHQVPSLQVILFEIPMSIFHVLQGGCESFHQDEIFHIVFSHIFIDLFYLLLKCHLELSGVKSFTLDNSFNGIELRLGLNFKLLELFTEPVFVFYHFLVDVDLQLPFDHGHHFSIAVTHLLLHINFNKTWL